VIFITGYGTGKILLISRKFGYCNNKNVRSDGEMWRGQWGKFTYETKWIQEIKRYLGEGKIQY
jgi:hypothetical protein